MPENARGTLRVGVGDDAAILRPSPCKEWVITCDQFIEGIHFLREAHPPEVVGYKALARATSDLAAMGAKPEVFLLSAALPGGRVGSWLNKMLAGMGKAARQFGLSLAGGDTARVVQGGVALNLTVLGSIAVHDAILRRTARRGDAIFVTGRLGAAQLGLEMILRGWHKQRPWRRLLRAHYCPEIHIELGQWLARNRLASAMMDVSDGLSTDLQRMCLASGVGARLREEKLPCVAVPKELQRKGIDPLALALHGGEDYGLLFTVPHRFAARIPKSFRGAPLTRIGEIVSGRNVILRGLNGRETVLEPEGWDHFRNPPRGKKRR